MPRPRKFDTDETIDQITTLFWAKGFDAVSIKEIAALTGLRPGSLYASFGNKDEIFDLAYERYGRI
ncbi:MAG: TetR/AcrR family transcriptional regulator, partial [Pseudomonadota bacterium]